MAAGISRCTFGTAVVRERGGLKIRYGGGTQVGHQWARCETLPRGGVKSHVVVLCLIIQALGSRAGRLSRADCTSMYAPLVGLLTVAVPAPPPRLVVVGGGAAGFFGAIRAASAAPGLSVQLLEAGSSCLSKVKISGGGRCNVLHDESKAVATIASGYPRGERALLGVFSSRFGPTDTAAWFREHGVKLKTEEDGRMFPTTDDSQSIIDALQGAAATAGVDVCMRARVLSIRLLDVESAEAAGAAEAAEATEITAETGDRFEIVYTSGGREETLRCRSVLMATGGAKEGHRLLQSLGIEVVPPVPSLFTFNVPSDQVRDRSPRAGRQHTRRGALAVERRASGRPEHSPVAGDCRAGRRERAARTH